MSLRDAPQGAGPSSDQADLAAEVPPHLAKYLHHLEEFDLPMARKIEILESLWCIVSTCLDTVNRENAVGRADVD